MVTTLLIAIVAVLCLQALAQFLCVRLDARKFPAPGAIVKTSRGTMHVRQMGCGGPPIIMEAGIAASSLNWSILQPQLAAFAATYSYDRPGFGWSAPSERECTLQEMSDDLHALVTALKITTPYVLVGHSFGALVLRAYAQRFPEELAGIILVDPLTPEEWIKPHRSQRWQLRRGVWFSRAGAALGALAWSASASGCCCSAATALYLGACWDCSAAKPVRPVNALWVSWPSFRRKPCA